MVPDQFSHLLEEIHKLETELGHLPQKWKVLWDKLELPNTDSLAVCKLNIRTKNVLYVKLFLQASSQEKLYILYIMLLYHLFLNYVLLWNIETFFIKLP